MSISKEKVFTMAAALTIIKSAVVQVVGPDVKNLDTIVFNSLAKVIDVKKGNNK